MVYKEMIRIIGDCFISVYHDCFGRYEGKFNPRVIKKKRLAKKLAKREERLARLVCEFDGFLVHPNHIAFKEYLERLRREVTSTPKK